MSGIYLQIRLFVQSLNSKRNQKVLLNEVQSLLSQVAGEQYFLSQLLESFDIQKEKSTQSQKAVFLNTWLTSAVAKSHFIDYFAGAIESVSQSPSDYVNELSNCLKLPIAIQLILFLSLSYGNCRDSVRYFKRKLHDYFIQSRPQPLPQYVLHPMLFQIRNIPELNELEPEIKFLLETVHSQRQPDMKPLFEDSKRNNKYIDLNQPIDLLKLNEYIRPVELLQELGPSCCSSLKELAITFQDVTLNEDEIFACILHMVQNQTYVEDQSQRDVNILYKKMQLNTDWELLINESPEKKVTLTFDIDIFLQYCQEKVSQLRWIRIIERIDRPNLNLDQKSYVNLMAVFAKMKKLQQFIFPYRLLIEKWIHRGSQLNFISNMIKNKPELVSWSEIPSKRWIQADKSYWSNMDFFQTVIELSEGHITEVRELFEAPLKNTPDLVIIGLAQCQFTAGGALIDELFTLLFPNYVTSHANSVQVLEQLWKHNQSLVVSGICELYRKEIGKKDNSCLNLSRVLDITQSITQGTQTAPLLVMAKCTDYHFSVPLGILAGKREFLNFDGWLQERIKSGGQVFVNILLQYLYENVVDPIREQQQKLGLPAGQLGQMNISVLDALLEKAQLKLEMITIIIEQLMNQGDKLGAKIKQQTQSLYKELVQVFPQLAGQPNQKANQEVEKLTDVYFNQFYNETLSLQDFLQLMVQWKTTGSFQDKEVFACIITNLYNEYQYHTKYPLKELHLTGMLFGGIIDRNLVDAKSLQLGLQIILLSIKTVNIRYEFAVKALEQIKNRLPEWPETLTEILKVPHLLEKSPELTADIVKVCEKAQIEVPANLKPKPPPPIVIPQQIQQIVQQQQQQQQNVVHHMVAVQQHQSVTPTPVHVKPVQETLTPQPQSSTPSLTMSFKEVLNLEFEEFDRQYTDEQSKQKITFILNNISKQNLDEHAAELRTRFLNPDTLRWFTKSFSYIRIPKTSQTQNKEVHILHQLIQAIGRDQIFAEISRELCLGLTTILKYNRPTPSGDDRNTLKWMGSFLGQVTLFRNKPFLNKYFDYRALLDHTALTVHVLCKVLEWSKQSEIFNQANKWLHNILNELDLRKSSYATMINYEIVNLLKYLDYKQIVIERPRMPTPEIDCGFSIQNLPNFIQVDAKSLRYKLTDQEVKALVAQALEKAITDIIPPVISRSVTIGIITTREIVFKDFSQEPDENKLMQGLRISATNLSGSLAMVTCREPLKARIQLYLKDLLLSKKIDDDKLRDDFIQTASAENLEFGCALIKKAVIARAHEEVNTDQLIQQELDKRRKFREKGLMYRDDQMQVMLQFLPEALQPRPTGLTDEEIEVYKEFGQKKQNRTQAQRVQQLCQIITELEVISNELRIKTLVDEILNAPEQVEDSFYRELGHKIVTIVLLNSQTYERISIIFELINPLIAKVVSKTMKWNELIQQFIEQNSSQLETSPMWWLAFPVMLKIKLITTQDLERIMLTTLTFESVIFANGVVNILRETILQQQLVNYNIFKATIKEITRRRENYAQMHKFLQDLTASVQNNTVNKTNKKLVLLQQIQPTDILFVTQVQRELQRWFMTLNDQEIDSYLQQVEFLKSDEYQMKFLIYAIELCANFSTQDSLDHSQVEQLALLVVTITRTLLVGGMQFFDKFLDALLLIMTKFHEHNKIEEFNQRPINKLLYNCIYHIEQLFKPDEAVILYVKIASFLDRTDPVVYPGFCFAWIELLSNRYFISIINTQDKIYAKLIIKLLEFVRETVTEDNLKFKYVSEFLKAVYRLFVILLHDFPKLLCTYAQQFADEVPFYLVQLINMLSAAYLNKDTQDPTTCANIYEIEDCNQIAPIVHASLEEHNFLKIKEEILQYQTCTDEEARLKLKWFESQNRVQISGFFIVLPRLELPRNECYRLLSRVIRLANFSQRNVLFNVLLNQIRFPEKVTEFYIKFIAQVFIQGDTAQIQEQFATLITQRLIVENPKTWGMLYLHEELMKTDSPNNHYQKFQVQRDNLN